MITSSKISTTPRSVVSSRSACRNATSVGMIAVRPAARLEDDRRDLVGVRVQELPRTESRSFGSATSIVSTTARGMPVEVGVSNGG